MPLPVPNLDDRTFAQLATEGRSLIPRYTRAWTDHNVSDPGITLLELFAYLVETSIYELNQLPDEAIEVFLELMAACAPPGTPLADTIGRVLTGLRDQPRAVTAAELTRSAREIVPDKTLVARVEHALIFDEECDADVSLISIVAGPGAPPPYGLEDTLYFTLKQRALLGTRIEVARAVEIPVSITTTIVRIPGGGVDEQVVTEAVQTFLSPFPPGGPAGEGWPFGRTVYRAELYRLLESLPGVDHVESLELSGPDGPVLDSEPGVQLPPGGLVAPGVAVQATVGDPS